MSFFSTKTSTVSLWLQEKFLKHGCQVSWLSGSDTISRHLKLFFLPKACILAKWSVNCTLNFSSVSSVAQSCLTLGNPMNRRTPGLPVHHQLPEFTRLTSIESVMPSSHLILCRPLLLLPPIPPSIRVFSNESTLRMRWPKYWTFSFSIIPSKEIPGLISFRIDWLDLLTVQGTLKSLLQHHSSKASILRLSAFFIVQFSHPYMTTGKTIALARQTFVGKVISLLLNMLSRLVITFLPRSNPELTLCFLPSIPVSKFWIEYVYKSFGNLVKDLVFISEHISVCGSGVGSQWGSAFLTNSCVLQNLLMLEPHLGGKTSHGGQENLRWTMSYLVFFACLIPTCLQWLCDRVTQWDPNLLYLLTVLSHSPSISQR